MQKVTCGGSLPLAIPRLLHTSQTEMKWNLLLFSCLENNEYLKL